MEKLLKYLNGLTVSEQQAFATRCKTSIGYLRKAVSTKHKRLGESICINIERESGGAVKCESMRPDVDWQFIRESAA